MRESIIVMLNSIVAGCYSTKASFNQYAVNHYCVTLCIFFLLHFCCVFMPHILLLSNEKQRRRKEKMNSESFFFLSIKKIENYLMACSFSFPWLPILFLLFKSIKILCDFLSIRLFSCLLLKIYSVW